MKNTSATTVNPVGHQNLRLTNIRGWGVRCECGFDFQPGRGFLKSDAKDMLEDHRTQAAARLS